MLRRALLLTSLALLGLAGVASARLVADPTDTTPIAGGPTAVTTTGPATTTTPPFTTTTVATTTIATTTTKPVTTTRVATTTTTATPKLAESASASTLVISGHGWGHAIGMAQWGADGYAQHGWDYRRILAHYYQGTTVAAGASPTVRVLLLDGARRVALTSDSPWKVVDRVGTTVSLPAGTLKVAADLVVSGQTLVSPLTFSPGATPLQVGGASYHGELLVVSNGTKLQVVNALGLESYVLGVVGREMPSSWPAAALETQAVAARSYALAELENVVTARAYDLYNDDRSQVYGGIAAESPPVTAAVRATARQVVLYGGKVATTYFSSSSGGRTVSAGEAWGKPIPYLVSVADPYDTLSPYHNWGPVLFDARKAAAALKVPGALQSLTLTPSPSGRVGSVNAVGANGAVTLTASTVRAALGLRSTWFTIGWLALTPPAVPLSYGGTASLAGVARGVQGVSLEAKGADGTWQTVSPVTPAADGSFSITIRPQATTQYRLASGDIRAALLKVAVAPLVSASLAAGMVQGSMKPALSGAAVQIQRQDGVGWTTVATGTTDVSGAFAVSAALTRLIPRTLCPGTRALARRLAAGSPDVNKTLFCAVAAALAVPALALAFPNTEPLAIAPVVPGAGPRVELLAYAACAAPVKVAVIDSGIDYGHPEFAGRVIAGRSFVAGSSWKRDTDGHGTFVAGLIAADPGNGQGIAGLAFNAQLLIAKVVQPDGNVYLPGEVAAIKWAVRAGAQVINLSLGGGRDPQDLRQRLLLARGARCDRVRGVERRGRRRGGRQWHRVADDSVALRRLSSSASARARSECASPERLGPGLLESRPGVRRHGGARRRDVLDDSPQPRRCDNTARVRGSAVLELRPAGISRRDRDVVRRAAGRGCGGASARRGSQAHRRPGGLAARALGARRERGDRVPTVPRGPGFADRLGEARRAGRADLAQERRQAAAARPVRAERQRREVGASIRASAHDQRLTGLLGRSDRRLLDQLAEGAPRVRAAFALGTPVDRSRALESGNANRRG